MSRDRVAMQHAVAEWLLLGRSDVLIRTRKSSFSDEAALVNGVRCIAVGEETDGAPSRRKDGQEEQQHFAHGIHLMNH